jgi:hypothetical protein
MGKRVDKLLLKAAHAAALCDMSAKTFRDACLRGRIEAVRIGKNYFVRPQEIQRLIKEGYRENRQSKRMSVV